MNNTNIDYKIAKYNFKLQNAKTKQEKSVYQQKLKYYKKLNMHGGDYISDVISKQTQDFENIISDQNRSSEEAKKKIDRLRDDIKQALNNHETMKKKAETMCDHLKRIDQFLLLLKSKKCNVDELQNLTLGDLLDETKFSKLCSSTTIIHPTITLTQPAQPAQQKQDCRNLKLPSKDTEYGSILRKVEDVITILEGQLNINNNTLQKDIIDTLDQLVSLTNNKSIYVKRKNEIRQTENVRVDCIDERLASLRILFDSNKQRFSSEEYGKITIKLNAIIGATPELEEDCKTTLNKRPPKDKETNNGAILRAIEDQIREVKDSFESKALEYAKGINEEVDKLTLLIGEGSKYQAAKLELRKSEISRVKCIYDSLHELAIMFNKTVRDKLNNNEYELINNKIKNLGGLVGGRKLKY
ncbi:hypothetical protein QKU48_gp0773 [Fadolivirus algeromassiliense]|jgi:hypothetical protein|uniref:Uncharacterized protein n=1 Tax=Fadolivirus FV1/VV64 TaxID=3070911 RepID=A0A7D3UUM1_9VIRU|nr:hypothetical protein QKU48_gp0773 [Fadolivirus algeromassiliense]QKF94231.1 hypothetical protein Fadolivirus_1_773 [Fadolivirus FV1/VV64]